MLSSDEREKNFSNKTYEFESFVFMKSLLYFRSKASYGKENAVDALETSNPAQIFNLSQSHHFNLFVFSFKF